MHEFDDLFDIQILHDKNELSLAVEMKLGRKMWIEVIKHHLKRNITTLLDHKWSIIKPYNGMSWFTSDHPVVKLEYSSDKEYNLKGGWGKQKTDIFMPLSPEHMMFTEIGSELPDSGEFSFEITYKFQKFIAEKAYRYIFSDYKNHIIPILKPRVVNKKLFEYEGDQWRSWHKNQSEAENK
jgi:hypothetical protein